MPRILAIDWDRDEARALLLASGPTGASVLGAWAVSLATDDPNGLTGPQIGARLAAVISPKPAGKVTTLVGVGRDNVQMQLLSLPPAPAEELPELVRFQADREFTALAGDAALDFIPLSGDAQSQRQVLAIALTSTGLSEAREVCAALGVEPNRLPLRACAAASLVHRANIIGPGKVALVVNPLTEEADLTVQDGEKIVLMRTVRLPDRNQLAAWQRALSGEIRRTMAAVRQQLADRKVDQVIVCGSPSLGDASGLADEIEAPVTLFDPTAHAPAGLSAQRVAAESLSRFAAVLGMAMNEADRRPPIIDFANVRRAIVARRFTRAHALAAAAATAVILGAAFLFWWRLASPVWDLAALNARIQATQTQADKFKDATKRAAAIERWLGTNVNWLDELEQVARVARPQPLADKQFPVEDDVVATQVVMGHPEGNSAVGGQMTFNGVAKSDDAVRKLEERLAAASQHHLPGRIQKDSSVPGYPRSFDLTIHVPPTEEDDAPAPTATRASETASPPAAVDSAAGRKPTSAGSKAEAKQ